jgi:hypothetical protein
MAKKKAEAVTQPQTVTMTLEELNVLINAKVQEAVAGVTQAETKEIDSYIEKNTDQIFKRLPNSKEHRLVKIVTRAKNTRMVILEGKTLEDNGKTLFCAMNCSVRGEGEKKYIHSRTRVYFTEEDLKDFHSAIKEVK